MNLFEGEHPEMGRVALWGGGLLLVTWLPLCAAGDASGVGSGAEPTLTQLQGFIGEAACKTNEDCRTIAIGAKACGGPDAYLAWSARQTDAKALAAAAKRYAELRRSQHEQAGRMSNCAFVSDPGWVSEVFRTPDVQAVLYFAFFILTDPPTSPVTSRDQLVFAAIVAVTSFAIFEWMGAVYYLLAGVLVGNVWEAWRRRRFKLARKSAAGTSRTGSTRTR